MKGMWTAPRSITAALCLVTAAGVDANVVSTFFSIDPGTTYLRTNLESSPSIGVSVIDLVSSGFVSPEPIRLEQLDGYRRFSGAADTSNELVGVFSTTDTFTSSSNLNRVVDAIEAGADYATGPTFNGSLSTDIDEDFLIDDLTIQIPTGGAFLFLTVDDSFFSDNDDPDSDFGVRISTIPEPSGFSYCLVIFIGVITAKLGFRGSRFFPDR